MTTDLVRALLDALDPDDAMTALQAIPDGWAKVQGKWRQIRPSSPFTKAGHGQNCWYRHGGPCDCTANRSGYYVLVPGVEGDDEDTAKIDGRLQSEVEFDPVGIDALTGRVGPGIRESVVVNPEAVGDPKQTPVVRLAPNVGRRFGAVCACGGMNGYHVESASWHTMSRATTPGGDGTPTERTD